MGQFSLVKVQALGVRGSLGRLPVHHEHAWDLRQFGEDNLVVVLDAADYPVFKQVPEPFIFVSRLPSTCARKLTYTLFQQKKCLLLWFAFETLI